MYSEKCNCKILEKNHKQSSYFKAHLGDCDEVSESLSVGSVSRNSMYRSLLKDESDRAASSFFTVHFLRLIWVQAEAMKFRYRNQVGLLKRSYEQLAK